MIAYKCKNCGGQMDFGGAGGFLCPYCGSKAFFSDADFRENEEFRKKLLQFYKAQALQKDLDYEADRFWEVRGRDSFVMGDGQPLIIEYMRKEERQDYSCYLARESVVYLFPNPKEAEAFSAGLARLVFPPADSKLHRAFPEFKRHIDLKDGGRVLVFVRRPNCYPAVMFAPWASVHLAWVISRMENICCALEYAHIRQGDISPESLWVNPLLHEGTLFGDWRGVREKQDNQDLIALRKTAAHLAENTREPRELYDFINSPPETDAFRDFARWDRVIEEGFGGHHFTKMNL